MPDIFGHRYLKRALSGTSSLLVLLHSFVRIFEELRSELADAQGGLTKASAGPKYVQGFNTKPDAIFLTRCTAYRDFQTRAQPSSAVPAPASEVEKKRASTSRTASASM